MRLSIMLILLLSLAGCAHATIHEICSDPDTLSRYKDYNQCYAEETANREAKRQRHLAWMRSMQNNNSMRCVSTQNGSFINTNCQ